VEVLQRLQPLDIFFAVLWAAIVVWGLQTGIVRQLGMLIGVYGAALLAGSLYQSAGQALGQAFGRERIPQFEFVGYVALFAVTLGVIGLLIWRAYQPSRRARQFGIGNILGAGIAAVWGALFLIELLTILRFYVAVPWRGQETTQQWVLGQVQASQIAPLLQTAAAPLWQIMAPWFPAPVQPSL
jgi:uncharacterized membrane protein required for colicin V production